MHQLHPIARPFAAALILAGSEQTLTDEQRYLLAILGPIDRIKPEHAAWASLCAAVSAGDDAAVEANRDIVARAGLIDAAWGATVWLRSAALARQYLQQVGEIPDANRLPVAVCERARALNPRAARIALLLVPAAGPLPHAWDVTLTAIIEPLAGAASMLEPQEVRDLVAHRASHPGSWPAWFANDEDCAAAHAFGLDLWFAVEARKGQALARADMYSAQT